MKITVLLVGLVAGVALGIPWLALDYFAWQVFGFPFAPYALFGWVVELLPGGVVTAFLEVLVGTLQQLNVASSSNTGKLIESASAWLLLLGIMGVLGALYTVVNRANFERIRSSGASLGVVLWLILLPASWSNGWSWQPLGWTLVLSIGWGIAVAWVVAQTVPEPAASPSSDVASASPTIPVSRRRALTIFGAGAFVLTLAGFGLARLFARAGATSSVVTLDETTLQPPPTPAAADFEAVPGTRPEITPLDDFYRVDINLVPPTVDASSWNLEVSGLVSTSLHFTYTDFTALPHDNFYATLECISNQVAGDLISTTWFSGVPLRDILDRAGLLPTVDTIRFSCTDGYTESLPLNSAVDPETRLCFAMGGQPLQVKHGFPVRLFTPNRFGMKNPKWITKVEAIRGDYQGFWEERGWTQQAIIETTSVMDTTTMGHSTSLDVGGIAYAGARGIQSVEIRVDEGDWQPTQLKPPLSNLTWVLWRALLPLAPGNHLLTVRATDGTGQVQIEEPSPPIPDGATGYDKRSVSV